MAAISTPLFLPAEIIAQTLNFLTPYDLEETRRVSKLWHDLSNNAIEKYDNFHHLTFKNNNSGFKSAKVNPKLSSLRLEAVGEQGNVLVMFAKAHPQLNLLSIKNCKNITPNSLLLALQLLNNLESVTLIGQGMFDKELINTLGHKSSLKRIHIIDTSTSEKADYVAFSRCITELGKNSKIHLTLTLPNKEFSTNSIESLKEKFIENPGNLRLKLPENINITTPKKTSKGLFRCFR